MTVIELGELRDAPDGPPRPVPRAAGRPARLLLVLAVAVATLGGAAPVRARFPSVVPAPSGATPFQVGDRLYLTAPVPDASDSHELIAYPLAGVGDGDRRPAVLWRAPLPGPGEIVWLTELAGTVLVTGPASGDDTFLTVAFDRATGERRWQQPGAAVTGRGKLYVHVGTSTGAAGAFRRLDPATGRPLWSLPVSSDSLRFAFDVERAGRVVLVAGDGPTQVWDADSGRRLRAAELTPGRPARHQRAQVAGDLLLVVRGETVTGYGLDELDRRWQVQPGQAAFVTRCAALICVEGPTGGLRALDPATGRTVWSDPRWTLLADRDGRLVVTAAGPATSWPVRLLDPATGRGVADLGDWQLASPGRRDAPLIGTRWVQGRRLAVARLDLAVGRAWIWDVLPDVQGRCQAGTVLLCPREDGSFALWRLDR
ncbi:PQQ-like beta-propeller repeat protein [Micromonospora sp. PLK6-60]|uniref:outer membrane protein assembly factor BamB family protein n=1 Tax=Micromonospora sp. PLK6-60 TaxID=2873383 RepID=UPI001CA78488|nr:PQQ-binding-like beta-propeller repeat protein [Micromonospora sp. PLK6-60]MBY8871193.1 PQQ-like beta-propeller repeat protein [Micromonospora sp. PLK6-60]